MKMLTDRQLLVSTRAMGGAEFKDWMARAGLSLRTASVRLGLSKRTVIRYSGGQTQVPRVVELACMAVEEGLDMTYTKTIPMHKRLATGEPVTGMKKGGKAPGYKSGGKVTCPPMKKGGKVKKGEC